MEGKTNNQSDDDRTLLDVLYQNVIKSPNQTLLTWVNSNCKVTDTWTYIELWKASNEVVRLLSKKNIKEGDRVMVSYPPGLDFIAGMLGCMLLGVIPCSVYPPNTLKNRNIKHSFQQFNNQVFDAGARFGLTTASFKLLLTGAALKGHTTGLKWITTDGLRTTSKNNFESAKPRQRKSSDIAFIQYSSGSTSDPKGVIISHGAIMHNLACIYDSSCYHNEEAQYCHVSWLPQYHDYALTAMFLMSVFSPKRPLVAFSPIDFIKNPVLWADVLENFNGTHTAGPNFAYGLLAKRMKQDGRTLQSVHIVCANIAAEPIAPVTLNAMKEIGIPDDAITPCYGMAELCAYVSITLGVNRRIVDGVVSVGDIPLALKQGMRFLIVEKDSKHVVPDGMEGEIHISSPSLASGYWNKPDASLAFKAIHADGQYYLATGDIGKIVEDRLYVSGRIKELIIINGKNIFPYDLERSVEIEFPNIVRPGSIVAYQHTDSTAGIVLEIRDSAIKENWREILTPAELRTLIRDAHDVEVSSIYFISQGSVPKTTSGKLRRVEARNLCLQGNWPANKVLQTSSSSAEEHAQKIQTPKSDPSIQGSPLDFETVIGKYIGETKVDTTMTWDELGLISMDSIKLRDELEDNFHINLPPNWLDLYETPDLLKSYVLKKVGQPVSTNIYSLPTGQSWKISWATLGIFQLGGMIAIITIFSVSIIPSWHLAKLLISSNAIEIFNVDSRIFGWMWVPLSIPVFMLTFSASVILCKWLVIGKYQESEVNVPSLMYLRWWIVDRLLHVWENWVGQFILDTMWLNLFYYLMGAKIDFRAKLNSFIREFDLVTIGPYTEITHVVTCRRFGLWHENASGPTLKFRYIKIEDCCIIKGLVSLGSIVGAASTVEQLSTIPECGVVIPKKAVSGSPAFYAGESSGRLPSKFDAKFEALKLIWIVIELYNFITLLLVAQILIADRLPPSWRYKALLYWFLCIILSNIFCLFECIILKWIFIGKRRVGPPNSNLMRRCAIWAADYHFKLSVLVLHSFSVYSGILWNSVFKLMGMKIDWTSYVNPLFFPPSIIDLVSVKQSYLTVVTVDVMGMNQLSGVQIVNSSIGWKSAIKAGVQLYNLVVPPLSLVEESNRNKNRSIRISNGSIGVYTSVEASGVQPSPYLSSRLSLRKETPEGPKDDVLKISNGSITFDTSRNSFKPQCRNSSVTVLPYLAEKDILGNSDDDRSKLVIKSTKLINECILLILYTLVTGIVFLLLIPGFELWMYFLQPKTIYTASASLTLVIVAETVLALLFLKMLQCITFQVQKRNRSHTGPPTPLHLLCITYCYSIPKWTFLPLLYGTPTFGWMARFMGSTVEWRSLCFPRGVYDWPFITFSDRAVIDDTVVMGHVQVYQAMTIGPCRVSGVVHPGSCFSVGADMPKDVTEFGPMGFAMNVEAACNAKS